MIKNYKVSVVISAHNEQATIKQVLQAVLAQKESNWELSKLMVYCDGCTDQTGKIAKSIKSSKLLVVDDGMRFGKVGRVQQGIKKSTGDIIVIFDADLELIGQNIITDLVNGFRENNVIKLVGGNTRPRYPKSFFERAVYSTFEVFEYARNNLKEGNNIFGCTGGCLAVETEFAKSLKFPNVINEDDYFYFTCLEKGFLFKYVKSAVTYYYVPNKLMDYLKQIFRSSPEAVNANFFKYFGKLVMKEYHRPFGFFAKSVFLAFLKNPLGVVYISLINLFCKPLYPIISKQYKLSWYTATSTKKA